MNVTSFNVHDVKKFTIGKVQYLEDGTPFFYVSLDDLDITVFPDPEDYEFSLKGVIGFKGEVGFKGIPKEAA